MTLRQLKLDGFLQTAGPVATASRQTRASTTALFTAAGPVRAVRHNVSQVSLLCGTTFTLVPATSNPAQSY